MSARRVFTTPEVVSLILPALKPQEIAYSLLRINSTCFSEGRRVVWASLPTIDVFLAVLLDEELPELDEDNVKVSIPDGAVDSHLERVREYGECVKYLNVFPSPTKAYLWKGLTKLVDAEGDLLLLTPRLRILDLCRRGDLAHSEYLVRIIRLFVGPACREINIRGANDVSVPWLLRSELDAALNHCVDVAQGITSMQLFVKDPVGSRQRALAGKICALEQLESLGLSLDILSPKVLKVVSRLPALSTLRIRGREGADVAFANHRLAPGCFQVLTRLSICDVRAWQLAELLQLTPMLTNLTRVHLVLRSDGDIDSRIPRIFEELGKLLHLTDLSVTFPPALEPLEVNRAALEKMISVPLERMHFVNARVAGSKDCAFFRVDRWSTIKQLLWPHQPATWYDLRRLATRHALQVLQVDLCEPLDLVPVRTGLIHPISAQCLHLLSTFRFPDGQPEDMDVLARYLISCWTDVEPRMAGRLMSMGNTMDTKDALWYQMLLGAISRILGRPVSPDTLVWRHR